MFTLTRPLIVFDLETTGVNPKVDRIMELGLVVIEPTNDIREWSSLINPGIPIPREASLATRTPERPDGITNELVQDAPRFQDVASNLAKGFSNADLAGFNIRGFDIPLLDTEFRRCGLSVPVVLARVIDAYVIYQRYRPRNLADTMDYYLKTKHIGAHSALADARAALNIIAAQLKEHKLPNSPEELHEMFFGDHDGELAGGKFAWEKDELVLKFGKHLGTPLQRVPKPYLQWVLKSDFPQEVKKIVSDALNGKFPKR